MVLGEKARDTPYEVDITIPVEGYEPIQFTLTKMCGKLLNLIALTELNFSLKYGCKWVLSIVLKIGLDWLVGLWLVPFQSKSRFSPFIGLITNQLN